MEILCGERTLDVRENAHSYKVRVPVRKREAIVRYT